MSISSQTILNLLIICLGLATFLPAASDEPAGTPIADPALRVKVRIYERPENYPYYSIARGPVADLIRVEATREIDFIPSGDDFVVKVFVEDLREAPQGVFATYVDVNISEGGGSAQLVESLPFVTFPNSSESTPYLHNTDIFGNGASPTAGETGLIDPDNDGFKNQIDALGSFSGQLQGAGGGEYVLAEFAMTATVPGDLTIGAESTTESDDPFDAGQSPARDCLLYGENSSICPSSAGCISSMTFVSDTVRVVDSSYDLCESNLLLDPSFEVPSWSSPWTTSSTNFGTPICDGTCFVGTPQPGHSGERFLWFGGIESPGSEIGVASQDVLFGLKPLELRFFFRMFVSNGSTTDYVSVFVDETEVWKVTAADANTYGNDWNEVVLDLSQFSTYRNAPPQLHTIRFYSDVNGDGPTSIFVDDANLCERTPAPPTIQQVAPILGVDIRSLTTNVDQKYAYFSYLWESDGDDSPVTHGPMELWTDTVTELGDSVTFTPGETWTVTITPYAWPNETPGDQWVVTYRINLDGSINVIGWMAR
ncbi:hypothetical protein KQI84_17110 [bacterium]|nr:hypothetical protein [bacterium]